MVLNRYGYDKSTDQEYKWHGSVGCTLVLKIRQSHALSRLSACSQHCARQKIRTCIGAVVPEKPQLTALYGEDFGGKKHDTIRRTLSSSVLESRTVNPDAKSQKRKGNVDAKHSLSDLKKSKMESPCKLAQQGSSYSGSEELSDEEDDNCVEVVS